jgi:hypothetical protein
MQRRVVFVEVDRLSGVDTDSIIRAITFYQTARRNIPEDIFILASMRARNLRPLHARIVMFFVLISA